MYQRYFLSGPIFLAVATNMSNGSSKQRYCRISIGVPTICAVSMIVSVGVTVGASGILASKFDEKYDRPVLITPITRLIPDSGFMHHHVSNINA